MKNKDVGKIGTVLLTTFLFGSIIAGSSGMWFSVFISSVYAWTKRGSDNE